MRFPYLVCGTLLAISLPALASHKVSCSIHVTTPMTSAALETLAGITKKDAETVARANLTRAPSAMSSAEIAVKNTCLVWSIEFKRAEKPGSIIVFIDAGDGRFLSERFKSMQRDATNAANRR